MPLGSFREFLQNSLQQGPTNVIFEHGMYSLLGDLELVLRLFESAAVPFELIGGLAVNAHLLAFDERSRTFVTRDVDGLVRRTDLPAIQEAATRMGWEPKRIIGGFALIQPNRKLSEAVHLIFVGEKPRSSYPVTTPELAPQILDLLGFPIPVAPIRDLLVTKLNSLRPKDLVHLEILDEAGLITPEVELSLPDILQNRLHSARSQFDPDRLEEDDPNRGPE